MENPEPTVPPGQLPHPVRLTAKTVRVTRARFRVNECKISCVLIGKVLTKNNLFPKTFNRITSVEFKLKHVYKLFSTFCRIQGIETQKHDQKRDKSIFVIEIS